MTGAGHGLYTGLQIHGGQGVHGDGDGQQAWQHSGGKGHENVHARVPHGKIAGHVGQKHIEHIFLIRM